MRPYDPKFGLGTPDKYYHDAFYIVDAEGQKITSHEKPDRIQQYLLDGLASKLDFIHSGSIANDIDKAFDDSRCGFLPVWVWG